MSLIGTEIEFLKKYYKPIVFVLLVILIAIANFAFGWSDMIANGQFTEWLEDMRTDHFVEAALIYVLVSIVCCVVLALPGVLFAVAAGYLFGPVAGTILCWIAVSLGAVASFVVGRYFLKDSIKPMLAKNKTLNNLFFDGARKSDVYLLAITRLIPIFPYNLQNFAYGITDVTFWHYTIYSAIFMLPGTAVYTIAAAGFSDLDNIWIYIAIALVLLALTLAVAWALKKKSGVTK